MKRILSIIMATFLLASLAACGNNSKTETNGTQTVTEEQKKPAESTAQTASKAAQAAETVTEAPASAAEKAPETEAPAAETPATETHSDVLVAFFSATGTTKGVAERIASVTVFERKKTNEKNTSASVTRICSSAKLNTSVRIRMRSARRLRTGCSSSPATWKKPCRPPHTTKCQLAPCHRPLTRNTIIRFSIFRFLPCLFPPSGMYR